MVYIPSADGFQSSHKYQQLPLISVGEFLQQHPEHGEDDETALMTARINHEHAEREALEQVRQGLLKKKQVLIADNKKRKDDLANLDKDLEKFIDVGLCTQHFSGRWLTTGRLPNRFRRPSRRNTRVSLGDGGSCSSLIECGFTRALLSS